MAHHGSGSPPRQRGVLPASADGSRSPTVDVPGRRWRFSPALTLLVAFLGAACGSDQQLIFTSAEPPEPASVRLFLNGGDVTSHVPMNSGFPQEIEVRLHAANGARISGYDDHFAVAMEIVPVALAVASDVENRPLVKLLTPTGSRDEPGSIFVRVTHAHTTVSRTFGPFDTLVH